MTDGLLIIDKPAGWTSHDVVAKLRRLTGERRIGHAGTLDPGATGVLVLCLGRATRLLEYLREAEKVYECEIVLGVSTDTDDAEGQVIRVADASSVTPAQVRAALAEFVGTITQTPPHVSAVHIGGKRAYAVARAGQKVQLPARTVVVHSITVQAIEIPRLTVRIHCGSGVYIRSIARDLGARLGVGAHVARLRRLAVDGFRVDEAATLEQVAAAAAAGRLDDLLLPPLRALAGWPVVTLSPAEIARVRHGHAIPQRETRAPRAAAVDAAGRVVAILESANGRWQPVKVLPQEGDR
ncbi:MAG: tRNA pseudouridine(55) synthase TruB [Chloroflexota bacterium]|nr:tRNA pseudouridine(55) synthase TruB [Dehalococcoidia bacterium]MDW8252439.1 tRNA pseudouridine(55) synthase TruB [Chloroflexota bacterium]